MSVILVVCVASILVLLGPILYRIYRYRSLVARIEALHGGTFPVSDGRIGPRPVLEEVFGEAAVAEIGSVALQSDSVHDADLGVLNDLTHMTELSVGRNITDEGLRLISQRPTLESLWLRDSNITAKGIESLSSALRLERLRLEGRSATDETLAGLTQVQQIRSLAVVVCEISPAGLEHVSKLRELRALRIHAPGVSFQSGFEHLLKLEQFEQLQTVETPVTDQSISRLRGCKSLRRLHLTESKITDSAMEHLATMPNLEELDLGATDVTAAGLERLKELKSLKRIRIGPNVSKADAELLVASKPDWQFRLIESDGIWKSSVPPERFGP